MSRETFDLVQLVPIIGTELQLLPLGLFLVGLLIYKYDVVSANRQYATSDGRRSSVTILPITVLAVLGHRSMPYVTFARERLVYPFTVIHSAFDRAEVHRVHGQAVQCHKR